MSRTRAAPVVVPDLAGLEPLRCPCGWARRALGDVPGAPASLHQVEVEEDARAHYHKGHTEVGCNTLASRVTDSPTTG
jgi:hypothetical protein